MNTSLIVMNSYSTALQKWTAFFPSKHTPENQQEMFPGESQTHLMALLVSLFWPTKTLQLMLQPILNLTASVFSFITSTLFLTVKIYKAWKA